MYKSLKKLFSYNKEENGKYLAASVVGVLYMLILLVPSELIRIIVSAIDTRDKGNLSMMLVWCLLTVGLTMMLIYLEKVLLTVAFNRSEKNLQSKLLTIVCKMKKARYQTLQSGTILTQITQNVSTALQSGVDSIYSFSIGILGLIFSFLYMSYLNMTLMISLVIFNIVVILITSAISKKLKHIHENVIKHNNNGNHLLLDMLDNSLIIRLFEKNNFFGNMYQKNEEGIYKANFKAFALQNGMNEMIWCGKKLAEIILIFGIGGYLVSIDTIDVSIIATFTIISEPFTKILKLVVDSIFSINRAIPSINAISELFEEQDLENEPIRTLKSGKGKVIFENISFCHGDKTIFEDISFQINPGDKVIVVGDNGQGKTTLLNLIAGLYRPDKGNIFIDGENICGVNIKNIAEKYRYISQKPQIFYGNGYQNLTLSDDYDIKDCDALLSKLGLTAVAKEDAKFYSEGEKQRLCIGRAIHRLSENLIILGDEIFANIDKDNRQNISELLATQFKNNTVIIVSHEDGFVNFNKKLIVANSKIQMVETEVDSYVG